MSDPVFMDFSEPGKKPQPKPKKRRSKKDEPGKALIPSLPTRERPLTSDEVKRGISERSRSAANFKVEGFTYVEIADMLEYETAADAKRAVDSVLAATHGPGDYETLRIVAGARAEVLLKRSLAMAAADYLVLPDGERVPNTEKRQWHLAAQADVANWAAIVGAKAPTKVEITPGEVQMDRIVAELLARGGHEDILDAEVIELDVLPDVEDEDAEEF